ncbi:sugar transferase [Actinacidiphila glaucinigra]|uniref:sugar transferase n=1 Tax=Actinacidiphila glaucinigra TaxID=235986 RepID=UPI00324AB7FB
MHADNALRVRLADRDGSHRAAVLADIKRRAGGQSAPAKTFIPALVGGGSPGLPEDDPGLEARPSLTPLHPPHPIVDKSRWYLPTALITDALGVALPVGVVFDATLQPHPVLSAIVAAAAWIGVRTARARYTPRALGESRSGRNVLHDWLILIGVLAVARMLLGDTWDPHVLLLALSPALMLTAACRKLTYRHLLASRREAHAVRRVLLIGEPRAADYVVRHLAAGTDHEYVVVGTVPVGSGKLECGTPVAARLESKAPAQPSTDSGVVLTAARKLGADLVLVAPGPQMDGDRLRRLAWAVHDAGVTLAVLPGLADVAVRRVELTSAAGLTLLHIRPPARRGVQVALKSALDRTAAVILLLLLSPLIGLIAAAIRLGSNGPVFYQQIRHGRDCVPFTLWKFRTLVTDAEVKKPAADAADGKEAARFKERHDPWVTRVGWILRRTSLDELPQLINVLRGEMSLVGPRPPLPQEVARYDEVELRRLSVKPGLTGLWQVSGRSDLSWDETLRLDLRYVDNWSLASDFDLLARTFRAVVDGHGAY